MTRIRRRSATPLLLMLLPLVVAAAGCVGVRRELTVESEPAGALVYINGEEVGRTPLVHPFLYYGTMDVKLRKDGYETLEDAPRVWAPFWQVPPLDLFAEAFSLTDRHRLSYELTPLPPGGHNENHEGAQNQRKPAALGDLRR